MMNMNAILAAFIGGWEMVLILAVILMLFGAKKLPELARGLGSGIKEFKKATREVTDEINSAIEDTPQRRYPPSSPPEALPPVSTPTANSTSASASSTPPGPDKVKVI
jgi:sec-independent protein translocase protein TatA